MYKSLFITLVLLLSAGVVIGPFLIAWKSRDGFNLNIENSNPVTLDSETNVSWTAACFNPFVSATLSANIGNNNNRLLVLLTSAWNFAPIPSSNPTWAPTLGGSQTFSGPLIFGANVVWYMKQPIIGTGNILWATGGGSGLGQSAFAISLYNVDQTAPITTITNDTSVNPGFAISHGSSFTNNDMFLDTFMTGGQNMGQYPVYHTSTVGVIQDDYSQFKLSSSCEGWAVGVFHSNPSISSASYTITDNSRTDWQSFDIKGINSTPTSSKPNLGEFGFLFFIVLSAGVLLSLVYVLIIMKIDFDQRVKILFGVFVIIVFFTALLGLLV